MIYAGTKGWIDTVPVERGPALRDRAAGVLPGQPPRAARADPRAPARCRTRRELRQGARSRSSTASTPGRSTDAMAGGQERVPAAADPQRPVDEEDHPGDGADRRLPDRPRPEPHRGRPPLPGRAWPGSSRRRPRATRRPPASCWAPPRTPDRRGRAGHRRRPGAVAAPTTPRCSGPPSGWWPSYGRRGRRRRALHRRQEGAVATSASAARTVERSFIGMSRPARASSDAREVAAAVASPSRPARSTRSLLVSTRFLSAGSQASRSHQLLPLPDPSEAADRRGAEAGQTAEAAGPGATPSSSPRSRQLLAELAPQARRVGDLLRPAGGVPPPAHRPAAGDGGGHRQRRRADHDAAAGS